MPDLPELLVRVTEASGADRELDVAIWCAVVPGWRRWSGPKICPVDEPDDWGFTREQQDAYMSERQSLKGPLPADTDDRLCKKHGTPVYTDPADPLSKYDGQFASVTKNPNRRAVDPLTASLDAALALVDRVLPPETDWRVQTGPLGTYEATIVVAPHALHERGETPALALLAALLQALISQKEPTNG